MDEVPTQEEVEIALMRGPFKSTSVISVSVGILLTISGAVVLGIMSEEFVPALIGSIMTVIGVFVLMAGMFAFRKYSYYRKVQFRKMMDQVERLALGEGAIPAVLLVQGNEAIEVMVPNDSSVLGVRVAEGPAMPIFQMRPGLVLIEGLRGRDGSPAAVCVKDLYEGLLRFYPGMARFLTLTMLFVLFAIVFINSAILILAIAYPPDSTINALCGGFGGLGAALLIPAGLSAYRFHRAYAVGRERQEREIPLS